MLPLGVNLKSFAIVRISKLSVKSFLLSIMEVVAVGAVVAVATSITVIIKAA
jgi:hypothetical protein